MKVKRMTSLEECKEIISVSQTLESNRLGGLCWAVGGCLRARELIPEELYRKIKNKDLYGFYVKEGNQIIFFVAFESRGKIKGEPKMLTNPKAFSTIDDPEILYPYFKRVLEKFTEYFYKEGFLFLEYTEIDFYFQLERKYYSSFPDTFEYKKKEDRPLIKSSWRVKIDLKKLFSQE